jgi:hypothetical protein
MVLAEELFGDRFNVEGMVVALLNDEGRKAEQVWAINPAISR